MKKWLVIVVSIALALNILAVGIYIGSKMGEYTATKDKYDIEEEQKDSPDDIQKDGEDNSSENAEDNKVAEENNGEQQNGESNTD